MGYETYVREEPDCGTCDDSGRVLSFPPGTDMVIDENCPDCNPTAEQVAARESEIAARPAPEPCTDARHPLGESWCDGCAPF